MSLGINPTCSEAVFRFYASDPKVMNRVLGAFAGITSASVRTIRKPEEVDGLSWSKDGEDAECIWEPHLNAFVLRIQNNYLGDEKSAAAFDLVRELGIPVEEAEFSPLLADKYARDCTCGNKYFEGYAKLLEGEEPPKEPKP